MTPVNSATMASTLEPAPPQVRGYTRLWCVSLLVLAMDQVTKAVIVRYVPENSYYPPDAIPIIEDFFHIVHIWNPGAAWGTLQGYGPWLAVLGILTLAAIAWFRKHMGLHTRGNQYAIGLLCGGIAGNLTDRAIYGHVIDFLDFQWRGWHWPAFNIADSGITVGVLLYFIFSFRMDHPPREPKD